MSMTNDYLQMPGDATIEEVLRAYLDRKGRWWWLLVTETEGQYYVCSFGSLLPYLTGRTPHIVHNIGDCGICSGMDPVLWRDTGALVDEALADEAICSRSVSDLPMAELPTVEAGTMKGLALGLWLGKQGSRVGGMTKNGAFYGMYVERMRGDPGGLPDF